MTLKVLGVLVLFFAGVHFAVAEAAPQSLLQNFDFEGNNPFHGDTLVFSALDSKVLTKGGHGFRNELKKKQALRMAMYQTTESLSARIEVHLSVGAKTIVFQYHGNDTHTLAILYVADSQGSKLLNGKANDGVFDVYVNERDSTGVEKDFPLATIANGGSFDFRMTNERGHVVLRVNNKTVEFKTQDSPATYLKFGDYLQAKDAVTDKQASHKLIPGFYQKNNITLDKITFSNVKYESE